MTLIQLFQQIAGQQIILNAMGKEKVYEIINTIFRLAGTGVNTNLQLKPGEDDSFVDQSAMGEAMNEMFNVVGEQNNRIQALEQILQQQASVPQNEAILGSDSELAREVARQQF